MGKPPILVCSPKTAPVDSTWEKASKGHPRGAEHSNLSATTLIQSPCSAQYLLQWPKLVKIFHS